jgi:DNA-binding transcriptional MerR regulator
LRDWQKAATCSRSEEEANLLGRIRWPLFVERIRTAKALQDMGFTLDEVIDALHAHDAGGATCESERWRLEAVVDRIATKITELERARQNAVTSSKTAEPAYAASHPAGRPHRRTTGTDVELGSWDRTWWCRGAE